MNIPQANLAPVRRRLSALWLALIASTLADVAHAQPAPGEYRISGGRVDAGTYAGWKLFHTACYGCHGVDAVGTAVAPSLVSRVAGMTPRAFAAKVLASYRIVVPGGGATEDTPASRENLLEDVMRRDRAFGGEVVMPVWEKDRRVRPHVLDLYAYLSARADGKLGPGEPKRADARR
jgi:mono/diheme cytochrome c family protein